MSLCDREAILESLLHIQDEAQNIKNDGCEEDLKTLLDFSFISIAFDQATFEMHRLIQLATRKWLETRGKLDGCCFPPSNHKTWRECEILFPHAKSAFALVP